MNPELFREKVRYYRPLTERTQEELAKAIGLSPYVLSHKLHGTSNARLTHREVQAIVKTLVEWGAMTRQAEARELLELMECPDFLPDEWNAPPVHVAAGHHEHAPPRRWACRRCATRQGNAASRPPEQPGGDRISTSAQGLGGGHRRQRVLWARERTGRVRAVDCR